MKKLKCESCGAILKIDENDKNIDYCEYCGSKYRLDDKERIEIRIDDLNKLTNPFMPIFIFVFIVILFGIMFLSFYLDRTMKNKDDVTTTTRITTISSSTESSVPTSSTNNKKKTTSKVQTTKDNTFDLMSFNSKFELYAGTSGQLFVNSILDEASTNNKKNKRLVTVVFGSINTKKADEIIAIKKDIKNKKYEIVLEYDKEGFVNKINIKDIY